MRTLVVRILLAGRHFGVSKRGGWQEESERERGRKKLNKMKSMPAPVPPPSKIVFPVSNGCTPQGHKKIEILYRQAFIIGLYIYKSWPLRCRQPPTILSLFFPTDTTIFNQRGLADIFVLKSD